MAKRYEIKQIEWDTYPVEGFVWVHVVGTSLVIYCSRSFEINSKVKSLLPSHNSYGLIKQTV